MIVNAVQFFLIDHLTVTGAVIGGICLGLKIYIARIGASYKSMCDR